MKRNRKGSIRTKCVLLRKLYDTIPEELRTKEVTQAYNIIFDEFDGYHQNPYNSFRGCITRILHWELDSKLQNEGNEFYIESESGEHCLSFREHRVDGLQGRNGGIIFRGFPDTGYTADKGIQLRNPYGWSTPI